MSHTPGPWKWRHTVDNCPKRPTEYAEPLRWRLVGSADIPIAWLGNALMIPKRKANAALIASAPELLALFDQRPEDDGRSILDDLNVAAGLLDHHCGEVGFALSRRIDTFIRHTRQVLDAAIAKTEKGA